MLSSRSSIDRALIVLDELTREYEEITGWECAIELHTMSWRNPRIWFYINPGVNLKPITHFFSSSSELISHFQRLELLWRKFNSSNS